MVVQTFKHTSLADRPDYIELAKLSCELWVVNCELKLLNYLIFLHFYTSTLLPFDHSTLRLFAASPLRPFASSTLRRFEIKPHPKSLSKGEGLLNLWDDGINSIVRQFEIGSVGAKSL
jgi:hypothetical protein